ncbi:hypothetical protein BGZ79_002117 [Entomortierella chlamydospora]|nr:hypothetical protein BGZ79_002117 [Entomortierella chlamydospora]
MVDHNDSTTELANTIKSSHDSVENSTTMALKSSVLEPSQSGSETAQALPTPTASIATTTTSVDRPSWATGDPFFDTMAGMDSPEYRKYYVKTTDDQLEEATATMSIADQTSNGEGSSSTAPTDVSASSSTSDASIGLDHWNKTREQWTKGRWHVVPSPNSNNPALNAIHPGNHDAIYDSLVYDRKRLSKPIPLPLVIKVLVSGWKRDGVWQESPAQPPSGSTPSSAPSHGLNAYVPGFSSTNSQPVARKS